MLWIRKTIQLKLWAVGIMCISVCFLSIATTVHLLKPKPPQIITVRPQNIYIEEQPASLPARIEIVQPEETYAERLRRSRKESEDRYNQQLQNQYYLYNLGDDPVYRNRRDFCN